VSWQVTGIRQDAWANANRIPVEVDKKQEDRGRYLHPELFGGEAITALARARDRGQRHRSNTPTV
jgi:trimeric autotransporter adhesin